MKGTVEGDKESASCCENCRFYSALVEPRVRSDGSAIFGYCFRHGTESYGWNQGKGYAVFITGGLCKGYKRATEKLG